MRSAAERELVGRALDPARRTRAESYVRREVLRALRILRRGLGAHRRTMSLRRVCASAGALLPCFGRSAAVLQRAWAARAPDKAYTRRGLRAVRTAVRDAEQAAGLLKRRAASCRRRQSV